MKLNALQRKVKEARLAKGYSQRELAKRSGVSYSTITKIEAGYIKSPKVEKMAKITNALGITVDDLLKP